MENKKLYRSIDNRIFAGVCGGLAEFFDADSALVRIIFVLLALANGFGILLYIVLAVIVPREPFVKQGGVTGAEKERIHEFADEMKKHAHSFAERIREKRRRNNSEARNLTGIFIVLLGFLFLLEKIFPLSFFSWGVFWPFLLIVLGIYLIVR
jgi:phage shock protein PspC (stress-responsive transcriptional regulator)